VGKYKNNKEERLSIYTYSTVQYVYVQCFIILFVFLDGGWKPTRKQTCGGIFGQQQKKGRWQRGVTLFGGITRSATQRSSANHVNLNKAYVNKRQDVVSEITSRKGILGKSGPIVNPTM
jgi:hypothetical protein